MISEEKVRELLIRDPSTKEARRILSRYNLGDLGLNYQRKVQWGVCGICGKPAQRIEHVLCREHMRLPKKKHVCHLRRKVESWKARDPRKKWGVKWRKRELLQAARSVISSATYFYLQGLK